MVATLEHTSRIVLCRDTPGKARTAVIRIKEELADAKAEVVERTREVQVCSPEEELPLI